MKTLTLEGIKNEYEGLGYYFPHGWALTVGNEITYKITAYKADSEPVEIVVKNEKGTLRIV